MQRYEYYLIEQCLTPIFFICYNEMRFHAYSPTMPDYRQRHAGNYRAPLSLAQDDKGAHTSLIRMRPLMK